MIADAATLVAWLCLTALAIGLTLIAVEARLRPSTDRPEDVAHALAGEVPSRMVAFEYLHDDERVQ